MNKNKHILIEWLKTYDRYLIENNEKSTLVVVGGSGLILGDYIDRSTKDIDSIMKMNSKHTRDLEKFGIDINSTCALFGRTFYGWENEVTNIDLDTTFINLTVKTLTLEMILASKFFTRFLDRDITEVASKDVIINKDKLEKLVVNIWMQLASIDKYKLIEREMEIIELYRMKGWDYEESVVKKLIDNKY